MKKYFAYDEDCSFELFDTKEEAIEYCQSSIDLLKNSNPEDLVGDIPLITWGEIKQSVVEISDGYNDEFCDFVLQDI